MRQFMATAWMLGLLGTTLSSAQEKPFTQTLIPDNSAGSFPAYGQQAYGQRAYGQQAYGQQAYGWPTGVLPTGELPSAEKESGDAATHEEAAQADELAEAPHWYSVWGLVGLRAIPAGPRIAPNGLLYHPNFSMDLDFNFWIWPRQKLYMFGDVRLWGQRGESGVTNGRDGFLGTSKREFDLTGGAAWNYYGAWELRAFGFTDNNLNRGNDLIRPFGFNDGFALENRYYLSPEYAKLGQTGFDVTKATFLSFGYYPSKSMVGHDGKQFKPGLLLRAYLTYDLGDWPLYVYGDVTYIGDDSFDPRLVIFDVGLAARPLHRWRQWEFRAGAESTADIQVHNVYNLWYVSVRFIF